LEVKEMKKLLIRKILVIGIIALFTATYVIPAIANENVEEKVIKETVLLEYTSIDKQGSIIKDKITLSEQEFTYLKTKINELFNNIKLKTDTNDVIDVITSFLDRDENSFLNQILTYLLNSEILNNRKLVFSQGWGRNLNPLKETKTGIVKPITFWRYTDSSSQLAIPSTTGIISMNPFEIKTLTASQFGIMLNFRGLYVNIIQSISKTSYTFFIGTARHIGGFEYTPLSSIFDNIGQ
jgi:hypothetical protein